MLSTVKVLNDVNLTALSILVCFDRLYFWEEMFDFVKLWLSGKYVVGSSMVVSNLVVCMFCFEIVFDIFLVLM